MTTPTRNITILGRKLQEQRTGIGLDLVHIATRCGLPMNTLAQFEAGEVTNPNVAQLIKVADGYGVDFDEILSVFTSASVPLAKESE